MSLPPPGRRPVHPVARLVRVLLALLALGVVCDPAIASPTSMEIGAQEMRLLGYSLLEAGDAAGAEAVADALIGRDATDKAALMLKAQAAALRGAGTRARAAARRVWRLSESPQERYGSALFVARSFAAEGRPGWGQFWLRRAAQSARGDDEKALVAADYRWLRSRNPLLWSLSFSVAPSSNVNDGSVAGFFTLPGLPIELEIGGAQQALSGVKAQLGAEVTWRLPPTATTMTAFHLSADIGRVALSREARRLAPEVTNGDFASESIGLGVTRRWRPEGGRVIYTFSGRASHDWYAGEDLANTLHLSARADLPLSRDTAGMVQFLGERQTRLDRRQRSVDVAGLSLGLSHRLAGADALTLVLGARDTASESPGLRNTAVSARLGWRKAEPVHGVGIEAWLDLEERRYRDSPFAPAGGRRDHRAALNLSLEFENVQYMGFSPVLGLKASRTRSNVALYETRDLGLQFGFNSAF